jgi:probable rRNA maturation factor
MPELDLTLSCRAAYRARGRGALLRAAFDAALAQAKLSRFIQLEALLRLTDDAELRALNAQFRDKDETTDVLSFASEEFVDGVFQPRHAEPVFHLGEIYISMPLCERQALEHGHSVDAELTLLTVHGALHLLGFDHMQARRKRVMWAAQDRAFRVLGVGNPLQKGS